MASRIMDSPQEFGKKRKTIKVLIFPNDTGVPTWRSCGGVASVTRSQAGRFLITLQDAYAKFVGHELAMQTPNAGPFFPQLGTVSNVGTSTPVTAVVRVVNGSGTEGDTGPDANTSLSVTLDFEDSTALSTDH